MIHPTAIVDSKAELATDVKVGPYTVIGRGVQIGAGSEIGSHVSIKGPTRLGCNTRIYAFASIGDDPQDKKFQGEANSFLEMGDNNIIREYVTINRGTEDGGGVTKIGNDNLLMTHAHIAHDCQIGNGNVFVNSVTIGGHVIIGDQVIFSAFVAIHQFCQVGSHAFLSRAAIVTKDVLPYLMVVGGGSGATVCGLNVEGLKRRGFSAEELQSLRRAYKVIYRQGLRVEDALTQLQAMAQGCAKIQPFHQALAASTRGVLR